MEGTTTGVPTGLENLGRVMSPRGSNPLPSSQWRDMNCPVCSTKMLHYENPDRDVCPNEANHGKHKQGRPPGTTQQRSPKSGGRIFKGRKGYTDQPKKRGDK